MHIQLLVDSTSGLIPYQLECTEWIGGSLMQFGHYLIAS